MKVLVTGAAGMLGSAIVRSLEVNDNEVFSLTRQVADLENRLAFDEVLVSVKPDMVIHAAAKVGGIQANISNPVEFLATNFLMDHNVIMGSLENNIHHLLYIGSSCMYPKDYRQPLRESDILQAPLEPTNEGYAIAKIAGAKLCEYATNSKGVFYKTIIPSNLFGPGDNFDPGSSHLLASVIRKVHVAKISGQDYIDVWGSGLARREFTYIDDLANWLASSISQLSIFPSVMNVGIGVDYSVNEFYERAMNVIGIDLPLKHDLDKPEGMLAKLMDSELARGEFGWNPATTLESGIQKTYDWFLRNTKER
jgi:GDP-L-fucose synthase